MGGQRTHVGALQNWQKTGVALTRPVKLLSVNCHTGHSDMPGRPEQDHARRARTPSWCSPRWKRLEPEREGSTPDVRRRLNGSRAAEDVQASPHQCAPTALPRRSEHGHRGQSHPEDSAPRLATPVKRRDPYGVILPNTGSPQARRSLSTRSASAGRPNAASLTCRILEASSGRSPRMVITCSCIRYSPAPRHTRCPPQARGGTRSRSLEGERAPPPRHLWSQRDALRHDPPDHGAVSSPRRATRQRA